MRTLFFSFLIKVLALSLLAPSLVFAQSSDDPQVVIKDTSSGHNWIRLEVEFEPGLLQGELYLAECNLQGSNSDTNKISTTSTDSVITFTDLETSKQYDCTVSVKRSDGQGHFESEPAPVGTITRPQISIESHEVFDTYIDFQVTSIQLEENESYIITCTPVNREEKIQSALSKTPELTIENFKPESFYSCQAAIKYVSKDGEIIYNESESINLQTEKADNSVSILSYTAYSTSIDFVVRKISLNQDEEYFVTCAPALGSSNDRPLRVEEIKQYSTSDRIKVSSLSPETLYSCQGGVTLKDDHSFVDHLGSARRIKTEIFSTNQIQILDYSQSQNSVSVSIGEFPLAEGENYILHCSNLQKVEKISTALSTARTITNGELDAGTEYECFVGVQRIKADSTTIIENKSSTFTISTKGSLPPASYLEEVISDWSNYKNPFPDTDINAVSGQAAAELHRRAVISGYEDGNFRGNNFVNRAEAAKFLMVARKGTAVPNPTYEGRFSDIPNGQWYTRYVLAAANEGVINGYSDGTFRPGETINRAEFLKMITKAFDIEENLTYRFDDIPADAWYARYAGAADKYNMFPDADQQLYASDKMTRYDVAVAIYQFLKNR